MHNQSEQIVSVLLNRHITEKGTGLSSLAQYLFKVSPKATKAQIKRDVETYFSVKVADVNTVNMMGKRRHVGGRTPGRRSDWKKAYVTLKEGYVINDEPETSKD